VRDSFPDQVPLNLTRGQRGAFSPKFQMSSDSILLIR
jgi:hypothetical protein